MQREIVFSIRKIDGKHLQRNIILYHCGPANDAITIATAKLYRLVVWHWKQQQQHRHARSYQFMSGTKKIPAEQRKWVGSGGEDKKYREIRDKTNSSNCENHTQQRKKLRMTARFKTALLAITKMYMEFNYCII